MGLLMELGEKFHIKWKAARPIVSMHTYRKARVALT